MSRVRFGILGFGHHAVRRLLPAFARSEEVVLTGLWRRNHAAGLEAAREFGIPHCFATAEELCASPDVDAVFVTSPDAMHRDDTLLALSRGKAVLCEKPLAMNAGEAEAMADAAARAGVLFGVAHNFRYNRSLEWMKEQITLGRIGTPQLAHAQFCYPAQAAPRKWIADPSLACGGPIGDVGVHGIDSLRFILGSEVESVTTLATSDALLGAVEATASLQMELTGGVLATVTTSARALYRTQIEVVGSDGALVAENGMTVDRPVNVELRRGGELVESVTLDNGDGYVRMLDGFAQALRGKGAFAATGHDGVQNQRVLDAAYLSWKSGVREQVLA